MHIFYDDLASKVTVLALTNRLILTLERKVPILLPLTIFFFNFAGLNHQTHDGVIQQFKISYYYGTNRQIKKREF